MLNVNINVRHRFVDSHYVRMYGKYFVANILYSELK